MRIKFDKGKQREFISLVMERISCPSLKELQNRLVEVKYSSLKNYFCGRRSLPLELFRDLVKLGNLREGNFLFKIYGDFWGQSKGGRISRK